MYALSLGGDRRQPQHLSVRIENQLNRPVRGSAASEGQWRGEGDLGPVCDRRRAVGRSPHALAADARSARTSMASRLPPKSTAPSAGKAEAARQLVFRGGRSFRWPVLSVRTITVDGAWTIGGALRRSSSTAGSSRTSRPLAVPAQSPSGRPAGEASRRRIVARIYTAYDDAWVFLAAAVQEDGLNCYAGQPVVKGRRETKVTLPYKNGMPAGSTTWSTPATFAILLRVPRPRAGLRPADGRPLRLEGLLLRHRRQLRGPRLDRGRPIDPHLGPRHPRRNGYQTEQVPGMERCPAESAIVRDRGEPRQTVYELSIPRSEAPRLRPGGRAAAVSASSSTTTSDWATATV